MKRKGSLTVFAALSLMLAVSLLLALLELARVTAMKQIGQAAADSALESVFAEYDTVMWEKYHLLMRSVGALSDNISFRETEQEIAMLAEASMNPDATGILKNSVDFFRSDVTDVTVTGYTLITDNRGDAFRAAVTGYMKENLPYLAAQKIQQIYEQGKDAQDNNQMTENSVEEALSGASDGIEEAKNEQQEEGEDPIGAATPTVEVKENPLEAVKQIQKTGIFALVLENPADISGSSIPLSDTVSHRTRDCGTELLKINESWYESILVNQYFLSHFGCYTSPDQEGALQYGLEYLLCGEGSDSDNLKETVGKLLLLRESCNLAFLVTNGQKQSEALEIATALAGFTANPVIITVVKYGILVAWAFAESILDLRALLQGDKIAIVKSEQQWTSDIQGLSQCTSSYLKAKDCSNGLEYKEYLGMLLYLTGTETLAYRGLDLQELYARKQEGYETFRMDHMAIALSATVTYSFQENFLSCITVSKFSGTKFSFQCESKYSYIKAGV